MLEDVLRKNLDVVICGVAAGTQSASIGRYYAALNNKFWRTLHEVGLTDVLLAPVNYHKVLDHRIGLTDLVKGQSGADGRIRFSAEDSELLKGKLYDDKPKVLCFNGMKAAKLFLGRSCLEYGLQDDPCAGGSKIFVAPSTSAMAGRYWKIEIWQELAEIIRKERQLEPESGSSFDLIDERR